eukprot:COSAG02_NODE_5781_length_4038_cov_145.567911_2_plen_240_part_00
MFILLAVGLILGTRLYYSYFPSAVPTEAAFERRTDEITREIGERGKRARSPAVEAPAPAPAPVPTPAPIPARNMAPSPPPRAHGWEKEKEKKNESAKGSGSVTGVTASVQQTAPDTLQELHSSQVVQEERETVAPCLGDISTLSQLLSQSQSQSQLSEMFYLQLERERERSDRQLERLERIERSDRLDRVAERERLERAERERAERNEARMFTAGFFAGACTCGLGAAIIGVALLQTKP